jgi:hypothetical protein
MQNAMFVSALLLADVGDVNGCLEIREMYNKSVFLLWGGSKSHFPNSITSRVLKCTTK